MGAISIENHYVSRAEINTAIEEFTKITKGAAPPILEFYAKNKVENIDVLFAGYLLLFKTERPDLKIVLHFPNGISQRAEFKLKQYGIYGYLLTGLSIFTLKLIEGTEEFDRSGMVAFGDKEFVLSEGFMLFLLVDKENPSLFKLLFESGVSIPQDYLITTSAEGVRGSDKNAELYANYRNKLTRDARPDDRHKCIVDLGRLAFFNCLHRAGILHLYVNKEYSGMHYLPDHVQVGHLRSFDAIKRYFKQVKPLFRILEQKPPIYLFIFSSLLSSEVISGDIDHKSADPTAKKLLGLSQFTDNLVRSLTELAKNLRDHTGTGRGVITASVISTGEPFTDSLDLVKKAGGELDPDKKEPCLDVHVIDLGTKGIIPKFLETSETLLENFPGGEAGKRLIRDDIRKLRDQTFRLQHLLRADGRVRLNQQTKRAVVHIGLLTLASLIEKNKGILEVDTWSLDQRRETVLIEGGIREGENSIPARNSTIQSGTFFTIILRLGSQMDYHSHLPDNLRLPEANSPNELKGIENLFSFGQIHTTTGEKDIGEIPDKCLLSHRVERTNPAEKVIDSRDKEYGLWVEILGKLERYGASPHNREDLLVHLDLEEVTMDASSLLRLAGYWETYFPKWTLLISNIPNEQYLDLARLNLLLTQINPGLGFWNEYSPLIFYSYVTDELEARFYFTDILLGKDSDDYFALNRLVRRNHFNSTSLQHDLSNGTASGIPSFPDRLASSAFFNGNVLLPFDLLLMGPGHTTLFEHNATMLLRNEIGLNAAPSAPGGLISQVKGFSGYRVANSHYRIGTKLHVTDFYYAKRIFQNNFFASRFAFLLAKEIDAMLCMSPEDRAAIGQAGLTLIGYGLYSELLLSLVEKFLRNKKTIAADKINHDLASDETDAVTFRMTGHSPNVIIIVPIASTFSTAIKVEERLREHNKAKKNSGDQERIKVLSPHYNVIHVGGSPLSGPIISPEEDFGWYSKIPAKKEIELKTFFEMSSENRIQRYFISLPTQWEAIERCKSCFPELDKKKSLLDEKPLFETDRSSVNPAVIFDYPKGRVIDDQGDKKWTLKLTTDMIWYGQYVPTNSHFIYELKTEKVLGGNKDEVIHWLREIKGTSKSAFSRDFPPYEHTIIISSCHQANIPFIDMVNEELFNSSANIIHYDPANDHVQNFKHLYRDEINGAGKIVFVDDTMKSGSGFRRIQNFVQQVSPDKGIDACILLINMSEDFVYKTVLGSLTGHRKIYAFADLDIYNSLSLSNTSTLQIEQDWYGRLAEECCCDSLKSYCFGQQAKLQLGRPEDQSHLIDGGKRLRQLRMIEATHRIYQYFSDDTHNIKPTFWEFAKALNPDEDLPKEILNMDPLDLAILKAITQYPFILYEPLRKQVFGWVLKLLNEFLDIFSKSIRGNVFRIEHLKGLRFLIRRACLMNSNYLVSDMMFAFIRELYSENGIPKLREEKEQELLDNPLFVEAITEDLKVILSFPVFFCAQIKELLSRNPYRSIQVEKHTQSPGENADPGLVQLITLLRLENTVIVQRFSRWLEQDALWRENSVPEKANAITDKSDLALNLLQRAIIKNHQNTRSLKELMKISDDRDPIDIEPFQHYLMARIYLAFDSIIDNPDLLLTQRARRLFEKLRLIIDAGSEVVSSTGIFLAIPDGVKGSTLVFDRNSNGTSEISSSGWPSPENTFIQGFMDGIQPYRAGYFNTVADLRKDDGSGKWRDLYCTPIDKVATDNLVNNLSYDFPSKDINGLLLMRLSRRTQGQPEKVLGILGVYFKATLELTDLNRVRYLLLLKAALEEFVERHYHNNEFKDWLNTENTKKLMLLAGHGRDMLRELYRKKNPVYMEIAMDLETLQTGILLKKPTHFSDSWDSDKIPDLFGGVSPSTMIDKVYFKSLERMIREIYSFKEIETEVDIDLQWHVPKDICFAFNRRLLNVICYEIVVNAKKNRWHFSSGLGVPGYTRNILKVEAGILGKDNSRQLFISISNIGPKVAEKTMDKLKHPKLNVKPDDVVAGTTLLKKLIIDTLKGKLEFSTAEVKSAFNMQMFTAKITLNEMNSYAAKQNIIGRESEDAVREDL